MSDSMSQNDKVAFRETIQGMRIMDDVFMNQFIERDEKHGYQALNVILKAFTGLDLKVRTAQVQSQMTGAGGRTVRLDIEAEDENGGIYDLEMQRIAGKVLPKRSVLHLSTIVTNKVQQGDSYEKVPEVWVIFVTETDFAGDGKPLHHYQFRDEDGKLLGDPSHIVMVNGNYKGTDTLQGKVIHDIMTIDPKAIIIPEIQQPFTDLKETEEGQKTMTDALAQFADKFEDRGEQRGVLKTVEKVVQNMTADGVPFEKIVQYSGSSAEVVQDIIDRIGTDSQPQLS